MFFYMQYSMHSSFQNTIFQNYPGSKNSEYFGHTTYGVLPMVTKACGGLG
jgi:hypothetical protein